MVEQIQIPPTGREISKMILINNDLYEHFVTLAARKETHPEVEIHLAMSHWLKINANAFKKKAKAKRKKK